MAPTTRLLDGIGDGASLAFYPALLAGFGLCHQTVSAVRESADDSHARTARVVCHRPSGGGSFAS